MQHAQILHWTPRPECNISKIHMQYLVSPAHRNSWNASPGWKNEIATLMECGMDTTLAKKNQFRTCHTAETYSPLITCDRLHTRQRNSKCLSSNYRHCFPAAPAIDPISNPSSYLRAHILLQERVFYLSPPQIENRLHHGDSL